MPARKTGLKKPNGQRKPLVIASRNAKHILQKRKKR